MDTEACIDLSIVNEFMELKLSNSSDTLKLNNNNNYESGEQKYKVIRYDKSKLNIDNLRSVGLFRSVILDNDYNVLCYSCPKSIPYSTFKDKYPDKKNVIANEFVEGTMINLFWDTTTCKTGSWQIATRSTVGANTRFYKNKTFKNMFEETILENALDINSLNTEICYSFVMQHPENRIVVEFTKPQLYLVGAYKIHQKGNKIISQNIYQLHKDYFMNSTVKVPNSYDFDWYSEIESKYASSTTSFNLLGAVITNTKTGDRTKIRNPQYEYVRKLKGNQPNLLFQYITLRKEGKVGEFLKYYPEHKKDFALYRDLIHNFTNALYSNYISCYINREQQLDLYPKEFKTNMFLIHQLYRNELKPQKMNINKNIIINYVNQLPIPLLMSNIM